MIYICAFITQITRLVDVKTVERVRAQSHDTKFNLDLIILQVFCHFNNAVDAGLVREDGDCVNRSCCIHYYYYKRILIFGINRIDEFILVFYKLYKYL
jgi:hypothetical protein